MKIKTGQIALSRLAKEKIIEYIRSKNMQPNDKLPSEESLMKMLGVSRYTVREALALLEQDKLIYKVQGKGTYIKKVPVVIESGLEKLESINEIIKRFGYNPIGKCLKIKLESPTLDMMEKLNISKEDRVITFTRIKIADDKLAAFCVDTVPEYIFKQCDPNEVESSMFDYFLDKLNIKVEYAVAEIIPTFPTQEMVELTNVKSNQLFLLLHQIHYDNEGRPVIYSMDYFNTEVFKFKINRLR